MNTIPEIRMNFKSRIKLNFDGGDLTSDSGMLLYKQFDKKIGFSRVQAYRILRKAADEIGLESRSTRINPENIQYL